jgi:type IV pilus assembly protein PilO
MALSYDSIIKLPTSQKVGILALVVALILIVYWQIAYKPTIRRIEDKERKLTELTREMKEKQRIAADYDKFKEETARIQEDLQRYVAKLPDQKEIPKLLKSISNMSQEAGLEVLLFKPQGEQAAEYYSRVPVELKFVGSYHRIGRFFYYVGTLPRIVNIENFSIQNAQKTSKDEFLLSTSCVATTYRYKESPPPDKNKKGKK